VNVVRVPDVAEVAPLVLQAMELGMCGEIRWCPDGSRYSVCTLARGHAGDHQAWGGQPGRPFLIALFPRLPETA
jgi:hypothetical protein